jgi:hypothetical protein
VVPDLTFHVTLGADDGELARVQTRYPCLARLPLGDGLVLRGTFPIVQDGVELDSFKVAIELRADGSAYRPVVSEIGGRVPRSPDRHVNADGSACIGLPEDLLVLTRGEPMLLTSFIDGPVRDYFLAQVSYETEGRWPFGDRGHGTTGVREFYKELLGTADAETVRRYLVVLSQERVYRQWFCPCGSGEKLRRCHGSAIAALRERVPPALARRLREGLRL